MFYRSMLITGLLALGSAACASPVAAPLVPGTPIVVEGGPGAFDWMTVDSKMHRLFATHKGTKTLVALNLKTDTLLPLVTVGTAQGVAVDERNGKVFAGNEEEQTVVVLDRKTLAKTAEIAVTGPVDDIAMDTKHGMLYADHDGGNEVWVINGKTNKIVATVAISGSPEYIEYDPGTNRLYQNVSDDDTIQVIDPATNKVTAVWKTAPASGPHGLAIDGKRGRVFSAGRNGILDVLDIKTGKVLTTVKIGDGVDQIAFDPGNQRIYCACHGVISVVQETRDGAVLLGDVPTPEDAHTLTVDPDTHAVWTCYNDDKNAYLLKLTAAK